MPTAAIVGAGLIGRSWAVVFARAGWDVRLADPSEATLAAAPGLIRRALDDLATHGLVDDPAATAALEPRVAALRRPQARQPPSQRICIRSDRLIRSLRSEGVLAGLTLGVLSDPLVQEGRVCGAT